PRSASVDPTSAPPAQPVAHQFPLRPPHSTSASAVPPAALCHEPSPNPLLTIQPVSVLHREEHQRRAHPNQPNHATKIKQPVLAPEHPGPPQQSQVPDSQQQPQLRWTKIPERQPKLTHRVRGQIRLNRKH